MSLSKPLPEDVLAVKEAANWHNKYRQLMLLGKKNQTEFKPEWQVDGHLVAGCESQVWLVYQNNQFYASSDSRIVSGLLYIILIYVNQLVSSEIKSFNLSDYLTEFSLQAQISHSRSNGLQSVLAQINTFIN